MSERSEEIKLISYLAGLVHIPGLRVRASRLDSKYFLGKSIWRLFTATMCGYARVIGTFVTFCWDIMGFVGKFSTSLMCDRQPPPANVQLGNR